VDTDCSYYSGCTQCLNGRCMKNEHGCGTPCHNDNACSDTYCSKCSTSDGSLGTCVTGLVCNEVCSTSTDCNGQSACQKCVGGLCKAPCNGGPCFEDKECDPDCGKCVNGLCARAVDDKFDPFEMMLSRKN